MLLSRSFKLLLGSAFLFFGVTAAVLTADDAEAVKLRAPAYPLVTHDPYFSIWSFGDKLTDVPTTHWTGTPQPITGVIEIDNTKYRFIGNASDSIPAMPQTSVDVSPTQTIYTFQTEQIRLVVRFTSPLLPDDIDLLSRPLTYLTYEAASLDGKKHNLSLSLFIDSVIAANTPEQKVTVNVADSSELFVLQAGTQEQPVLEKKGDNLRIDWGHFYLAARKISSTQLQLISQKEKDHSLLSAVTTFSQVGSKSVSDYLMLAYDDIKSIRYFQKILSPYWRRSGLNGDALLQQGNKRYEEILRRCNEFDRNLTSDLKTVGGQKYAELCALVYRQVWAANKIVAAEDGQPYMFSKENFSNGCIGTVDVLYPHTPFLLFFSPQLLKGSVVPVLNYSQSKNWIYGYAPHDLGTYPHATGQVYGMGGGDGSRMPVEESGNMLIIIAALAKIEGNAKLAEQYWELLTRWTDYLVHDGFDPANQLCSADMFGHLAHVTNLSLKAIIAIGAYSQLCEQLGKTEDAKKYRKIAEDYAKKWLEMSQDDGHTKLAFDQPGTWSIKHNLIWDTILETNLFPESLAAEEIAWYQKVQNKYGVPVDSRTDNALIDWILWSITPAKNPKDFETLFQPVYNYVNETPSRIPLSDWFITTDAKRRGFQARSVVGGVYIKMLTDKTVWKKYAKQSEQTGDYHSFYPSGWKFVEIVPTSRVAVSDWKYTLQTPPENWFQTDFDDSQWQSGKNGFGGNDPLPNNPAVNTKWTTKEIWLRREFELNEIPQQPFFFVYYDESPEIWINGVLAAQRTGYTADFVQVAISAEAKKTLKKGKNIVTVKASQTYGGQYIDVGIGVEIEDEKK